MHLLPELASHHAVSIPELLVSRDERQARQHAWLKRHPVPLISFTVVAPGPIKDSEVTRRIFNHGVTALRALAAKQGWQIQEQAALVSASGPEGMLSIAAPARDLKLATIDLRGGRQDLVTFFLGQPKRCKRFACIEGRPQFFRNHLHVVPSCLGCFPL